MNDEENNEKPLNSLINSFDNTNTKKFGGFVEKRFLGGLKRINKIDFKDSILKSVLDEDNYTTKQNFNKIEEEKMKKERKNLSKNTKKKSIERKNLRNIWTNNTNYTTQDTDNNKFKNIKKKRI